MFCLPTETLCDSRAKPVLYNTVCLPSRAESTRGAKELEQQFLVWGGGESHTEGAFKSFTHPTKAHIILEVLDLNFLFLLFIFLRIISTCLFKI